MSVLVSLVDEELSLFCPGSLVDSLLDENKDVSSRVSDRGFLASCSLHDSWMF